MFFPHDWDTALTPFLQQDAFSNLMQKVQHAYQSQTVYPAQKDLWHAFASTSFADTKVILLGQDPYHGAGQAQGLAFSVPAGTSLPPSLKNIYKELCADLSVPYPTSGDLTPWANQGVLLLNTVLTVQAGHANSHHALGWQTFTDAVLASLNTHPSPLVFLLWGKQAIQKQALITHPKHCILQAPHPSPLSAYHGFFGCKHFSKTNAFLQSVHRTPIDWQLP